VSKLVDLMVLEYTLTWRLLILGAVYAVMFAIYVASLRTTAGIFPVHESGIIYIQDAGSGYMNLSIFLVGFIGYVYSKSLAGQISSGLLKTILCYPIRRKQLLLAKLATNYLILMLAGLLPVFYSKLLYNVEAKALAVLLLAFALKLFFYSSVSIVISLLSREPLVSLVSSILILYAVEAAPSFLWSIHMEKAARIIGINYIVTALYKVIYSENGFGALADLDAVGTVIFYTTLTAIFTATAFFLFEKMDLD